MFEQCEMLRHSRRCRCHFRPRRRGLPEPRFQVSGGAFRPAESHSSRSGLFPKFSYLAPHPNQSHQSQSDFLDHLNEVLPYPLQPSYGDLRIVRLELPHKGPDTASESVLRSISGAHQGNARPMLVCALTPSLDIYGCYAASCTHRRRR